ncbi:MAG: 4-hydroxy-tetrahydrodipicolinate reductase [Clostridia bacterium]|jgi:4-hydroxy-tetrahydrodipicolinate reductase|nr:4-hydroxy-tetrahydrodipicolinate reductase [Clostridia bacterium]
MKILINGICGHMGREVLALCEAGYRGAECIGGVDAFAKGGETYIVYKDFSDVPEAAVDCIVDFSHHTVTPALLDFAIARNIPTVLCTTGHTPEEKAKIALAAEKIPLFFSANMSLGVALLVELAKQAAAAFPEAEIEIIEKHHDRKVDAPSGTALMLADALCDVRPEATLNCGRSGQGKRTREEIGIHAIRMGNIVGEHEVMIGTPNQTITLKHEAHSRALFAEGALAAAAFLVNCEAGMYDMKSLVSGAKTPQKV